jgi:hypothetical protein
VALFEMLQAGAPAARARMATARSDGERAAAAPAAKGKRPKSPRAVWGDFVDASFVRSARKLGYNPAEMWYVRDRMSAVRSHLLTSELQVSQDQAAELFRRQAEAMRTAPGATKADRDRQLQAAAQAERQPSRPAASPLIAQNLSALRQARTRLSDAAWDRIGSVAAGVEVSGLGERPEAELGRRLEELRQLHLHAVANREPPPG